MPYDFSQLLFSATAKGGTVVVGDGKIPVPHLASNPGLLLAPKDFTPEMLRPLANNEYDWNPERSASGPITMVVSAADKAIYVYRNGNPIGRAPVEIGGRGSLGDHVFSMLEGTTGRQSSLAPGRAARQWMTRDEQWPPRRCRGDRVAPAHQPGVCRESLRHHRAGHDRHHHRPTGRAEPPQRRDPRELSTCTRRCSEPRPAQRYPYSNERERRTHHVGR